MVDLSQHPLPSAGTEAEILLAVLDRNRRTIVDLIEEYARHTGHADLIRESVDGLVGEDAPLDG